MLVLILLIIIMVGVVYLATNKSQTQSQTQEQTQAQKMNGCGYEINEATFNPKYKISRDENGLEVVQSCGR